MSSEDPPRKRRRQDEASPTTAKDPKSSSGDADGERRRRDRARPSPVEAPKETTETQEKKSKKDSQRDEKSRDRKALPAASPTTSSRNKIPALPWDASPAVSPFTHKPWSQKFRGILEKRHALPVWGARRALLRALLSTQVLIVQGETGSGKTTQIPQFLAYTAFSDAAIGRTSFPAAGPKGSTTTTLCSASSAAAAAVLSPTSADAGMVVLPGHGERASFATAESPVMPRSGWASPMGTSAVEPPTLIPTFESSGSVEFVPVSVACTQPRRVAATSVAQRVADEADCPLGSFVGYSVRFDDSSSRDTRLKYLTDGMLLREAMADPLMLKYDIIILDECHERTAATDLLLGFLKQHALPQRALLAAAGATAPSGDAGAAAAAASPTGPIRPLRLVVMSATMDIDKFRAFFPSAPTLAVPGRMHPVTVVHRPAPPDYVEDTIATVQEIHSRHPIEGGDVLCFLTGEEEIERVCDELANGEGGETLTVLPLFSSLPPHLQRRVFEPPAPGTRKVVVSTNIAETSVTVDGVVFVVDCGFEKQKLYHARTRHETLLPTPISQAAATQRAGRAGRTRPGFCYRLYPEAEFQKMRPQTPPEMLRSNLASICLTLLRLGVRNLVRFDFPEPPPPAAMARAIELLHVLGCLTEECTLSPRGQQIAEMPLDPPLAAALLSAPQFGVTKDMLTVTALMAGAPIFVRPVAKQRQADRARRQFESASSDHITLLNAFNAWSEAGATQEFARVNFLNFRHLRVAASTRMQLEGIMRRFGYEVDAARPRDWTIGLRKALCGGYFHQVARHSTKRVYRTLKDNHAAAIHPQSAAGDGAPEFVLFTEFVQTSQAFLRTVSVVTLDWLVAACPSYFAPTDFDGMMKVEVEAALARLPR
eukprot:TRINITY_DN11276_c0_g1_i1.p1 TRINITY_DN11276_c0_g1~~TRINITY_DN11276_c0_g1_i1.p1  ORF type:complete len:881 (+),score=208.08 TRINITY_DN11276_c0_g1_i1:90-2732(+)